MATFDNLPIGAGGVADEVYVVPSPKRRQLNRFPRVNGVQSLDMGTDGGSITVEATLYGSTLGNLNSVELTFYGYQASGVARTFVDNFGNPINNCVLDVYEPVDRVMKVAGGGYMRRARLRFLFFI